MSADELIGGPLLEWAGAGEPEGELVTTSPLVLGILSKRRPDQLVATVPEALDADTAVLLGLSSSLGPEASAAVSDALASDPVSASKALTTLDELLGSRKLLVENLEHVRGARGELLEVVAPRRAEVARWLEARADILVADAGKPNVPVRPVPANAWDATLLFQQVGKDPERYVLASAIHRWSGALPDPKRLDAGSLVLDLWNMLPSAIRSVLGRLVVHGRPLSRKIALDSKVLDEDAVDDAIHGWLVDDVAGSLRLSTAWYRNAPVRAAEHGLLHRDIADKLAAYAPTGDAGIAILEAHRHYAMIPDIAKARTHARFGALYLLDHARHLSEDGQFLTAAQEYQAVVSLDDAADRRTVGLHGRAYAVHYDHFNRARAHSEEMKTTLDGYRDALELWPENALFWSRFVRCQVLLGAWAEALTALSKAYEKVPPHQNRDATLLLRTAERLLDRDEVIPALLVATHRPLQRPMALDGLWRRFSSGVAVQRCWVPGGPDLRIVRPEVLCLADDGAEGWSASWLGRTERADAPRTALLALSRRLTSEMAEAFEKPFAQLRGDEVARLPRLARPASNPDEVARWAAALAHLYEITREGEMSESQHDTVLALWRGARAQHPRLRRPALGPGEPGEYHVAWAYMGIADKVTVYVAPDGGCAWWCRDAAGAESEGEGSTDETLAAIGDALGAFLAPG